MNHCRYFSRTLFFFCSESVILSFSFCIFQPPGRYGSFRFNGDKTKISHFYEKPSGDGAWINGGFFVLEPDVLNYIDSDRTFWEKEPLEKLAQEGKLAAYRHTGYWQAMDTLRDKMVLEEIWQTGNAPWKVW